MLFLRIVSLFLALGVLAFGETAAKHLSSSLPLATGHAAEEKQPPCSRADLGLEAWRKKEAAAFRDRDRDLTKLLRLWTRAHAIHQNLNIAGVRARGASGTELKQIETDKAFYQEELTKIQFEVDRYVCRVRTTPPLASTKRDVTQACRTVEACSKRDLPECAAARNTLRELLREDGSKDGVTIARSVNPNPVDVALAWHSRANLQPGGKRTATLTPTSRYRSVSEMSFADEKKARADAATKTLKDRLYLNLAKDLRRFRENFERNSAVTMQGIPEARRKQALDAFTKNYRDMVMDLVDGKQAHFRFVYDDETDTVQIAPVEALMATQFQQAMRVGAYYFQSDSWQDNIVTQTRPPVAPDSFSKSIDQFLSMGTDLPVVETRNFGGKMMSTDWAAMELAAGGILGVVRLGLRAGTRTFLQDQAKDFAKDWATDKAVQLGNKLDIGEEAVRMGIHLATRNSRGVSESALTTLANDEKEAKDRQALDDNQPARDPLSANGLAQIERWETDTRFSAGAETDPEKCRREVHVAHLTTAKKSIEAVLAHSKGEPDVRVSPELRSWLGEYETFNKTLPGIPRQTARVSYRTLLRYVTEALATYDESTHPIFRGAQNPRQLANLRARREALELLPLSRELTAIDGSYWD